MVNRAVRIDVSKLREEFGDELTYLNISKVTRYGVEKSCLSRFNLFDGRFETVLVQDGEAIVWDVLYDYVLLASVETGLWFELSLEEFDLSKIELNKND